MDMKRYLSAALVAGTLAASLAAISAPALHAALDPSATSSSSSAADSFESPAKSAAIGAQPASPSEDGARPFSGIGVGVKVGIAGIGFDVATPLVNACGSEAPYSVFSDSLEVFESDWTPNLPAEFKKRRGYDLIPHLPELVAGGTPLTHAADG